MTHEAHTETISSEGRPRVNCECELLGLPEIKKILADRRRLSSETRREAR